MLKPPTGRWGLAVCYVNHAGFAIFDPHGARLLIDPFLGPTFPWEGVMERQLDVPPFRAQDLSPCCAIAITHDHGDHFEVGTCSGLLEANPTASLIGPAPVVAHALRAGVEQHRLVQAASGAPIGVGSLTVLPLPNRGSEGNRPCPRFSYLVADASGARVFHSGDSHGPSESWDGVVESPDLALLWPSHIEESIAAIRPRRVWVMHWGRFAPGNFLCNVEVEQLAASLRAKFPDVEVTASPPGSWVLTAGY